MTLQTQEFVIRAGSLDDVPAVVELTNLSTQAETGTLGGLTVERLRSEWSQTGFDPAEDASLVFDGTGTLLGAAEFWHFEPFTQPFVWARVRPGYEGQGIGTALLAWAEAHAAASLPKAPPDARYSLRANTLSTQPAALDLFRDRDYQVIRHFLTMEIAYGLDDVLPEPVWPDGVRVRTHVPGPDDRLVYEAVDEAFQDHWGYTPLALRTLPGKHDRRAGLRAAPVVPGG